jgi:hypothetical protein
MNVSTVAIERIDFPNQLPPLKEIPDCMTFINSFADDKHSNASFCSSKHFYALTFL